MTPVTGLLGWLAFYALPGWRLHNRLSSSADCHAIECWRNEVLKLEYWRTV